MDAAQRDRVEGFLRAPLADTLSLMSDHGAHYGVKINSALIPNYSGLHSLWEQRRIKSSLFNCKRLQPLPLDAN